MCSSDLEDRLRAVFTKLVGTVFFISSFLLIGLIPIAEALILFLIGDKWLPSVPFLQILAVAGIMYPVGEINLNILQVKGRADYILRLQTIRKLITIPIIIVGVYLGLMYLVAGIVLISFLDFFSSSYYSGRFIGFSTFQQLGKALPYLIILTITASLTWVLGVYVSFLHSGIVLVLQGLFYFSLSVIAFEIFRLDAYIEVKGIVFSLLRKKTNR